MEKQKEKKKKFMWKWHIINYILLHKIVVKKSLIIGMGLKLFT